MIVVDIEDHLRIITQPDHARLAGDLLSLWRSNGLPEHPRRDEILFAVREHDNGWQEADAAPRVDPENQRPHDFMSFPPAARREVWQRGIERHAQQSPYACLLIAEHAAQLHPPSDRQFMGLFEELEPRRREWLQQTGLDAATIREDYRWLRLADSLSLTLCTGRPEWCQGTGLASTWQEPTLSLDPFPLAGSTTFLLPVRQIPKRLYKSDFALSSALARSRWRNLPVRLVPA